MEKRLMDGKGMMSASMLVLEVHGRSKWKDRNPEEGLC